MSLSPLQLIRQGSLSRRFSYALSSVVGSFVLVSSASAQCIDRTGGFAPAIPFGTGTVVASLITTIGTVNNSSLAQSTAFVGTPSNPRPDQQAGGVWTRAIHGTVDTKANTHSTATIVDPVLVPTGSVDCRTTTRQDFTGAQFGMDVGKLNFHGGGNMHLGVTAGYFDVTARDRTPGQSTFKGDFQIPFAGVYGTISSGGFAFDAQLRADFIQGVLTDSAQGIHNQELDARTYAFLWNATYRFSLPSNWFVEPSIGGVWSRTEVDSFNVTGEFPGSLFFPIRGTAIIEDIDSLLGRASVRVGTVVTSGQLVWQPFATASWFHEFAGSVRTKGVNPPGSFPTVDSASLTSRVGSYSHLGLGIAATLVDTGWLGYARIDYRTGENIEGLSVNAGLRYQFAPHQSGIGGLKDGSDKPFGLYEWSGFYAGLHGGGLRGREDWTFVETGSKVDPSFAGYIGGGQIGYNRQIGHLVLGAEADYGFTNSSGGKSCPNLFLFTCHAETNQLALVSARIGLARDRILYYFKGGLALADVQPFGTHNLPRPPAINLLRPSETQSGWAAGAGMEMAISDRWSAKAEYMHFDVGSERFQVSSAPDNIVAVTKGDTVRIGVNYHFGKH